MSVPAGADNAMLRKNHRSDAISKRNIASTRGAGTVADECQAASRWFLRTVMWLFGTWPRLASATSFYPQQTLRGEVMLEKSQTAPVFRALNQNNELVNLSDYRGKKNVVLYFYPKDDTPGCTVEAIDFTQLADAFTACDAVVLGVSRDDCASHAAFTDKHGLTVRLLADTEGELCQRYGVWQEKEKNGVKKHGIVRSTFVIDKQGQLREAHYGVSSQGHARQVLEWVKALA